MSMTHIAEQDFNHQRRNHSLWRQRHKAEAKRRACSCLAPSEVTLPTGDRVCTECAETYYQGLVQASAERLWLMRWSEQCPKES